MNDSRDTDAPSQQQQQQRLWAPGTVIDGRYEVLGLAGEGGMGQVYRVRHRRWGIDLAVKRPHPGALLGAGERERFVDEAEAWVSLGLHPNICCCHYVRRLDGRPAVFAEYVSGGSLRDWIVDRRLYAGSPDEVVGRVLDVAIQFAWGLDHAHGRGLVHQDVKPANVLVDRSGDQFTVKVTDFGLARSRAGAQYAAPAAAPAAEPAPGISILVTSAGLTPQYASPEQVRGDKLGRRSDVFSYAASVLEMFTGERLWRIGTAAGEALGDYLATGPSEPELPPMPPRLGALLERCLRWDPPERPASMADIAAEIAEIYREAVRTAYPRPRPSAADLRADELNNRAVSLLDLDRTAEAEDAFAAALKADPRHLAAAYNSGLLRWRRGAVTDEALIADLEAVGEATGDPRVGHQIAQLQLERGDYEAARRLAQEAAGHLPDDLEVQTALRTIPSATAATHQMRRMDWHTPPAGVHFLSFPISLTADGRRAATGSWDGRLRLWDLESGQVTEAIQAYENQITKVDVSADGRYALTAGARHDPVRLWDLAERRCLHTWQPGGSKRSVSIGAIRLSMPAGLALIPYYERGPLSSGLGTSSDGGFIEVWDVHTGKRRILFDELAWDTKAELSPDGRLALVSGYPGHEIGVWELETGHYRHGLVGSEVSVAEMRFSADGRFAVTGENFSRSGGAIRIWDLATGECLRTLYGHAHLITSLYLTPDNRYIVSGSLDHTARLWEFDTGRCLRTFRAHRRDVEAVFLDTDTQTVLTCSSDNTMHRWALPAAYTSPYKISVPRGHAGLSKLAQQMEALIQKAEQATADGDHSAALDLLKQARATPGYEREPRLMAAWRGLAQHTARTGLRAEWSRRILGDYRANVLSATLSADASMVATVGSDKTVRLWDAASNACLRTFEGDYGRAKLSPDGSRLAYSNGRGDISVWSTQTGDLLSRIDGRETQGSLPATFSADGDHALIIGMDDHVRAWDLRSGRCIQTLQCPDAQLYACDLDPEARLAVTGGRGGVARLWDLETAATRHVLHGHEGPVTSICLSPDRRYILSGAERDENLLLWDTETGKLLRSFDAQPTWANALRFSADSRFALSAGEDATARLWDVESGRCLRILGGHNQRVIGVAFSPDGAFGLSSSIDAVQLREFDWDLEVMGAM